MNHTAPLKNDWVEVTKACATGLLVAFVFLLVSCAPPTPAPNELPYRSHVPVIYNQGYRVAQHGVGVPYEHTDLLPTLMYSNTQQTDSPRLEGKEFFVVDWWLDCSRHDTNGYLYIPMAWGEWNDRLLLCNDGRPLLVLNEPEHQDQANLTPEKAAEVWRTALEKWTGDVYCCGVMVNHLGYMKKIYDAYVVNYGPLPARARSHAHMYALDSEGKWTGATQPIDAERAIEHLDDYTAWARSVGLLDGGLILSEYGALDSGPAPEQLVPLMQTFEDALRLRYPDDVQAWAWFSINSDGLGGNSFSSSNLVAYEAKRTPLGDLWRKNLTLQNYWTK